MPRMLLRPIAAWLAGAALLAACTPTLNWRDVRLESSRVVALLPCKPDQTTRSVPLGGVPTDLSVIGCEAEGATFAVMRARAPAGVAPDEVLRGWQQATLANMRAGTPVATPFVPAGALALPHAQRLAVAAQAANGRTLAAQAVWAARPDGDGVELIHAVMYAPKPRADVADAFFAGIKWP